MTICTRALPSSGHCVHLSEPHSAMVSHCQSHARTPSAPSHLFLRHRVGHTCSLHPLICFFGTACAHTCSCSSLCWSWHSQPLALALGWRRDEATITRTRGSPLAESLRAPSLVSSLTIPPWHTVRVSRHTRGFDTSRVRTSPRVALYCARSRHQSWPSCSPLLYNLYIPYILSPTPARP